MARIVSLTAVRAVLADTNAPAAALFTSLLENGKNSQLRASTVVKERFGFTDADYPQLGKRHSPFRFLQDLPGPDQLQNLLLEEVLSGAGKPIYFPPPCSEEEGAAASEVDAAIALINNLRNANYEADGMIPGLPCAHLDQVCEGGFEVWDNALLETNMSCSVFPSGCIISLQHHDETTSFSTLLIGSIIWMAWPPTEQNLSKLRRAYEAFGEHLDSDKLDVAHELMGGVACVQSPGEAFRLPPHCIVLGLAREVSVLASYSILTVDQYLYTLRSKLPFLTAWWKTEANGEQKRKDFGAALVARIQHIISGELDMYKPQSYLTMAESERAGPLQALLQAWDEAKDQVVGVLDATHQLALAGTWKAYLTKVVGRNCAICGKSVQSKARDMGKHFDEAHWPSLRKRVDSVEVMQQSEKPRRGIRKAPMKRAGEAGESKERASKMMKV